MLSFESLNIMKILRNQQNSIIKQMMRKRKKGDKEGTEGKREGSRERRKGVKKNQKEGIREKKGREGTFFSYGKLHVYSEPHSLGKICLFTHQKVIN